MAEEDTNRAECIDRGEEAVKLIKEIGTEAAFMKIQYPDDDRFHWDKGYVFIIEDEKATFLANPVYPGKVGQELIHIAKTKGKGWVTVYLKPMNVRVRRDCYVLKVPDENLIVVSVLREEALQE